MILCLVNMSARKEITPEWLESLVQDLTWQLQTQDGGGFCAEYGLSPSSVILDQTVPFAVPMYISDTPDIPGAAGYHSVDAQGHAYVKDFALGSLEDLSVTISHEVLETVADPLTVLYGMGLDGTARAYEVCDPVEDTHYPGPNGNSLSNYVLPNWWGTLSPIGPFDKLCALGGAYQLTAGGYCISLQGGSTVTMPASAASHVATLPAYRRSAKRVKNVVTF